MSEESQGLNQAALRRLLASEQVQALLARLRAAQQDSAGTGNATPPASAEGLEQILGPAALEQLEQASGMPREALLGTLTALLPILAGMGGGAGQDAEEIPNHPGPGFGYGGSPPGQDQDPPSG